MKKLLCVLLMGISSVTVAKTLDEYGEMTNREFLNPATKSENIKGINQAIIDDYGHNQVSDAFTVLLYQLMHSLEKEKIQLKNFVIQHCVK